MAAEVLVPLSLIKATSPKIPLPPTEAIAEVESAALTAKVIERIFFM